MNDTTYDDPQDSTVATTVRDAGEPMSAAFRADLRATLRRALDGEPTPNRAPVVALDTRRRRSWLPAVAGLVAAAALAATFVVLQSRGGTVTPATSVDPAPQPTNGVTTPPSTTPEQTPAPTTAPSSTASPATAVPTTSVTAPDLAGAIDLVAGTVFGFGVTVAQDTPSPTADEVVATISARLGAAGPDQDTGWFDHPRNGSEEDCLGGIPHRVVRWGDLVITFWSVESEEPMVQWLVGDTAADSYFVTYRPDAPEPVLPGDPLPLSSADGVALGIDEADLPADLGERQPGAPGVTNVFINRVSIAPGGVQLVDGTVTAIGFAHSFC
jgi:hypothetical protein